MTYWSPGVTLEDVEKQVITEALRFYENNKTVTAKALGISVRTLHNKLNVYNKKNDVYNKKDSDGKKNEDKKTKSSFFGKFNPRSDSA